MRLSRHLLAALAIPVVLLLAACAEGPIQGSQQDLAQSQQQAEAYQLNTGDKLHIDVFGESNLSGDYIVSGSGQIAMPLVGNIQAAGLTLPQLQASVTQKLSAGYVKSPNVTVSATDLGPYYILGEVNKPGKYSYEPDLTVLAAVASAQGFTYRADSAHVYIKHARDASEQEYPLTATIAVQPGDTIRVAERYF